jgi:fimbrial chaperone protein
MAGLFLGLLSGGAESSAVEVSPTLAEVPAGKPAVTFELRNTGEAPVTFEARPFNWSQDADGDQLVPATDVVVVPPLFTIPPGGRQLVRIAPRARSSDHEGTYRVKFQEVPQPPPPGFVGLRTLLLLSVPLVYELKNGRETLEWRAAVSDGGELRLSATNRGSRFAHFGGMELRDGTRLITQFLGPQYVLAGVARTWNLGANPEVKRGAHLTLVLGTGARQQQIPLSLDKRSMRRRALGVLVALLLATRLAHAEGSEKLLAGALDHVDRHHTVLLYTDEAGRQYLRQLDLDALGIHVLAKPDQSRPATSYAYGKLPHQQIAFPGAYADSIVLTVTF